LEDAAAIYGAVGPRLGDRAGHGLQVRHVDARQDAAGIDQAVLRIRVTRPTERRPDLELLPEFLRQLVAGAAAAAENQDSRRLILPPSRCRIDPWPIPSILVSTSGTFI